MTMNTNTNKGQIVRLGAAVAFSGNGPPTEFRLFKAGPNDTAKGVFLFDARAAALVMAAANRWGVDLMIDLEHRSLDSGVNHDPDARGWFRLALRNGELWAVDVRWTPDGARRLSDRTQRYISPAFATDDAGRVVEIVNVALVAMPATHNTPALIAAHRRHTTMPTKDQFIIRLAASKRRITQLAEDGADTGDGKFAAVQEAANKIEKALAELDAARTDPVVAAGVTEACQALEAAIDALYSVELRTFTTQVGRVTLTKNQMQECARAGVDPAAYAERTARQYWVR